jgi:hypothetical protein
MQLMQRLDQWNEYVCTYVHKYMSEPSRRPATKNVCKTRGCNYRFELLMMGGVSPETCWAIKKHWNNKFYYTVASCWFFLWELHYDAQIYEHQGHYKCDLCLKLYYFFLPTGVIVNCLLRESWLTLLEYCWLYLLVSWFILWQNLGSRDNLYQRTRCC